MSDQRSHYLALVKDGTLELVEVPPKMIAPKFIGYRITRGDRTHMDLQHSEIVVMDAGLAEIINDARIKRPRDA